MPNSVMESKLHLLAMSGIACVEDNSTETIINDKSPINTITQNL